jgi:hypothetical protein
MGMDLTDRTQPSWESLRLEVAEVDRIQTLALILVLMEVRVVAVRGIFRLCLAERDRKDMLAERVIQHNLLQVVVVVLRALEVMHLPPQEMADFLFFT